MLQEAYMDLTSSSTKQSVVSKKKRDLNSLEVEMNRVALRSVIGGLRNGGSYISTAAVASRNDGVLGAFPWRRMMSTSAQTTTTSEEEKKKVNDSLVVSNYWGITRPKITREDGTEWPWNCFKVINYEVDQSVILTSYLNYWEGIINFEI